MVSAGFDRSEDPEAISAMQAAAAEVLPAAADAAISESWTGLRPRLQRGVPCVDRVRDWLTIATGHFRNGILLAPRTADLVADLVMGGTEVGADYRSALRYADVDA